MAQLPEDNPPDAEALLEQFTALSSATIDDLKSEYVKRMMVSRYPVTLQLTEAYCLRKFDMLAELTMPLCAEIDLNRIYTEFGVPLEEQKTQLLGWLDVQLRKTPEQLRTAVRSRVEMNLEAKRFAWLAKAKRLRADRLETSRLAVKPADVNMCDEQVRQSEPLPGFTDQEPQSDRSPSSRQGSVDAFLDRCKRELKFRVREKQIWQAAGHDQARQFQYWKASHQKAGPADHVNFSRILRMSPSDFESLLKKKGLIKG